MSSSLPNRSTLEDHRQTTDTSTISNYTLFTGNIKNPPRLSTTDDGSGTASNPKNISIINNRRRSESFAVYSGQEYFCTSSSPNETFTFGSYFCAYQEDDSDAYFSNDEQQQQQLFPQSVNVDKKIVLYKTEMCRTFEETGICKYGTKCQFAHDPVEIRNIPRHPRYKTEICKTFWQLGNCPYGKRCCFIHTENELRDGESQNGNISNQSRSEQVQEIYNSSDLTLAEDDAFLAGIQSRNSSRSASPSKTAEDIKKSINNVGTNSIFNNLKISNFENLSASKSITERRRKSIIDDNIEELAILVGSNCTAAAPSSEDPEFKAIPANPFELWTCESPKPPSPSNYIRDDPIKTCQNEIKFSIFDKSPGARNTSGIWSKGSIGNFIPGSQFYKSDSSDVNCVDLPPSQSSGTTSSKSSQASNHQQLLIDMLNLLDSSN